MLQTALIRPLTLLIWTICSLSMTIVAAQTDITMPAGVGSLLGSNIYPLSNGNIVVSDRSFSPMGSPSQIGAVFLIDGTTGQIVSTLTGSTASDQVGQNIVALPNGNYVVLSPSWDNGGVSNAGAFTFCSGITGCNGIVSSSNSMVGSSDGDRIGNIVRVLTNGNFVGISDSFDNGAATNAGAVTFCSGTIGCSGNVSAANSLVGSSVEDQLQTVTVLDNGNYVASAGAWDNGGMSNAGAARWCSGTTGCTGTFSPANSLVGTQTNDAVSSTGVTALAGGAYAVRSSGWSMQAGAVTLCNSPTGCVGQVNATNSVVGTNQDDSVGMVFELSNGNVVVGGGGVDINGVNGAGAVRFCDNFTTCNGAITAANSLHGTSTFDQVGNPGVVPLMNGNYVVLSSFWLFGGGSNAGAATLCSGTTGCTGPVTTVNSLHGQSASDLVGKQVFALPNGDYVVVSDEWEGTGGGSNLGAVTYCSGTTGCTGVVSSANSLVGSNNGDAIGQFQNQVLNNSGFVVRSPSWGPNDEGAVTFCAPMAGCPTGQITSGNSLTGTNPNDNVGSGNILPLSNSNYVVLSPNWDLPGPLTGKDAATGGTSNAGAATLCSGTSGCAGSIDSMNSLVGSSANDRVGSNGRKLAVNYVVGAKDYDAPGIQNAGALVWCDGSSGCTGQVSASNALLGTSADDVIGDGQILDFSNGDYGVLSRGYLNPFPFGGRDEIGSNPSRHGAVTFGNGQTGTIGSISANNSVIGTDAAGGQNLKYAYDVVNNQIVVARPSDGIVSLFTRTIPQRAPFDFDGDGRTDVSVFRPSDGTWYLNLSTNGFTAINWGLGIDVLAPADYDGDGKADIAIWRPGPPTAARFYILNSSDFSVSVVPFGQAGDDPVVVGDWDGDGKADPAVYRDAGMGPQSSFYYLGSQNNPSNNITFLSWGAAGDRPVKGDFDGDSKQDLAIFRPSTGEWWIRNSSDLSVSAAVWGLAADILVPGDYDGDGKTDLAVFRSSEGNWYYRRSSNLSTLSMAWGGGGDVPVPGDYDGDGRIDQAVFRPSDRTWYVLQSGTASPVYSVFGVDTDIPVPTAGVTN